MVEDDYATRLSKAMGAGGLKPPTDEMKGLAKGIGVSYQAVAKLWSGGSKALTASNNSLAAAYLNVDPDWLATGIGSMHSAKVWPFGDAISPTDFAALDRETVQSAIDVLQAALKRQRERLTVGRDYAGPAQPPPGQPGQPESSPARTSTRSAAAPKARAKVAP